MSSLLITLEIAQTSLLKIAKKIIDGIMMMENDQPHYVSYPSILLQWKQYSDNLCR